MTRRRWCYGRPALRAVSKWEAVKWIGQQNQTEADLRALTTLDVERRYRKRIIEKGKETISVLPRTENYEHNYKHPNRPDELSGKRVLATGGTQGISETIENDRRKWIFVIMEHPRLGLSGHRTPLISSRRLVRIAVESGLTVHLILPTREACGFF
jgi:hypothetical protein